MPSPKSIKRTMTRGEAMHLARQPATGAPIGGATGVLAYAKRDTRKREDTYDESVIERYLRRRVHEAGGKCKKAKTGENGWPDRMCLWSPGICDFIETKRPKGGKFEPLQRETHARLRGMGFLCEVISTKAQVDAYVDQRSSKWPQLKRHKEE